MKERTFEERLEKNEADALLFVLGTPGALRYVLRLFNETEKENIRLQSANSMAWGKIHKLERRINELTRPLHPASEEARLDINLANFRHGYRGIVTLSPHALHENTEHTAAHFRDLAHRQLDQVLEQFFGSVKGYGR